MNRLSQLRDQTSNSQEFLQKAAGFIAQELASRFVAIILKEGEQSVVAASTMPELAQQHNDVLLALANGAIAQGN
ncbi:MAG: hypothetical protein AABY13_03415, partial [Nanoarchaeota archaeon]